MAHRPHGPYLSLHHRTSTDPTMYCLAQPGPTMPIPTTEWFGIPNHKSVIQNLESHDIESPVGRPEISEADELAGSLNH